MLRGFLPAPKARALLPLVCLVPLVGCAEPDPEQSDEQAIIDGTPATAYPEAVHVNALSADRPTASCSGVLVAPRAVLTAAHCVDGYRGWGVLAPYADGQWAMSYEAVVYDWTTREAFSYTEHDVAIVFLPSDIVIDRYPVISAETVPSGTTVKTIGRVNNGFISDDWLFVSQPFSIVQDLGLPNIDHDHYYASVYRTVQKGDSGGPVVLADAEEHTVVAVNSTFHYYARLDLVSDWIAEQLAAHGAAPPD